MENQVINTPNDKKGIPPKTWLVESILVTLFCCLPFGVVSIIKSAEVNGKVASGDIDGAKISAIISTDISRDGTLEGPNLEALKEMAHASSFPVIASGGVGSMADILSLLPLEAYGVQGIIVGRALYDNKITLKEAIKVTKNRGLQDPPMNNIWNA